MNGEAQLPFPIPKIRRMQMYLSISHANNLLGQKKLPRYRHSIGRKETY